MCDCAGDASCVLRFCRAISLDAPKVADVRAAADCVEDLRGAAPDEVEAICAQWKVLAKGKFRRAVAALQEEVRQGADGAFDLDDAAPVTPAAREGEVRAAVARDGGGPEEAPAPEAPQAPAPAPAEWLASRSGVRVGATVEKRFPGYGVHRGTVVELGAFAASLGPSTRGDGVMRVNTPLGAIDAKRDTCAYSELHESSTRPREGLEPLSNPLQFSSFLPSLIFRVVRVHEALQYCSGCLALRALRQAARVIDGLGPSFSLGLDQSLEIYIFDAAHGTRGLRLLDHFRRVAVLPVDARHAVLLLHVEGRRRDRGT